MDKARPEYARLREVLRDLRLDRGWNQTQLAQRLGVRQEWVSRYECGDRRLDVVELGDVARALGVTVREVLVAAGLHR